MSQDYIIVEQRSDGRGGYRPFTSYSSKQAGATFYLVDRELKVTTDGRVNIPKSIMEEYGVKGDNGRYRIGLKAATIGKGYKGMPHWMNVGGGMITPPKSYKNAETNTIITVQTVPLDGRKVLPVTDVSYGFS